MAVRVLVGNDRTNRVIVVGFHAKLQFLLRLPNNPGDLFDSRKDTPSVRWRAATRK